MFLGGYIFFLTPHIHRSRAFEAAVSCSPSWQTAFTEQATPEYQVLLHSVGCILTQLSSGVHSTSHAIRLRPRLLDGFIMNSGVTSRCLQPSAQTSQNDFSLHHLYLCPRCCGYYAGKKLNKLFVIFEVERLFKESSVVELKKTLILIHF